MKPIIMLLAIVPLFAPAQIYKDTNASAEDRAADLLKQMTLTEKISLMRHDSQPVERLGIAKYNWWNEALHGVGRAGLATVFPQPIGLAATFDDRLVFDVFSAVSDEARAKNKAAKDKGDIKIYQGLTFWTPNVNLFRDPRWGRGHETYGEDPYLTSRMGVSVVRGLQGDNFEGTAYQGDDAPKYYKLHACAKHYAVHSGPEWSRHSINIDYISPRDLWETYLPAFKALVQDGGVKEVMCAYNRFEDQPCCGSNRLLNTILRQAWGYDGIVLSDCWALSDFHELGRHNTEPDAQHAAATALRTGTDLECGETYGNLLEAVSLGLVDEAAIDRAVLRLLTARYQLGEMDSDDLVEWTKIPYSVVDNATHRALALKSAHESMVLLKNNGILPLKNNLKLGLIGPNANDSVMQWGNYNGFPSHTSTLYEALSQFLPAERLIYVDGLDHTSATSIQSLIGLSQQNGEQGFEAKFWNNGASDNSLMTQEPTAKARFKNPLALTTSGATVWAPGVDLGGFTGLFTTTYQAEATENLTFSLQCQGWMSIRVNDQEIFHGGNMKSANACVLPVDSGQEYKIEVFFSASEGECASLYLDFGRQIPLDFDAILEQLADCDVIIYAGGLSPNLEGEEMPVKIPGFRGGDRETIELPAVQSQLLRKLNGLGKPVVMVNYSGSAVALTQSDAPVAAILQAWYPGQAGGQAVADVLFGKYNPSGRLPVTFYRATTDLPDIEDYNMSNRTYRYFKGDPLYPFGYGLSYTTFAYGDAQFDRQGDNLLLCIPVSNTGEMDGTEVVQVYLSRPDDKDGPAYQLRGFKRVDLPAGSTEIVEILLTPEQFAWWDADAQDIKPLKGQYEILYGPSSDRAMLRSVSVTR